MTTIDALMRNREEDLSEDEGRLLELLSALADVFICVHPRYLLGFDREKHVRD